MRGQPLRVLLVDDAPEFLHAIRRFLSADRGVHVVGASQSGSEALAAVPLLDPDLVLMDIDMPGMTGLEATREIKRTTPRVKVIIVTLHDWQSHRDAAQAAGADGFIHKSSFIASWPSIAASMLALDGDDPAPGGRHAA